MGKTISHMRHACRSNRMSHNDDTGRGKTCTPDTACLVCEGLDWPLLYTHLSHKFTEHERDEQCVRIKSSARCSAQGRLQHHPPTHYGCPLRAVLGLAIDYSSAHTPTLIGLSVAISFAVKKSVKSLQFRNQRLLNYESLKALSHYTYVYARRRASTCAVRKHLCSRTCLVRTSCAIELIHSAYGDCVIAYYLKRSTAKVWHHINVTAKRSVLFLL